MDTMGTYLSISIYTRHRDLEGNTMEHLSYYYIHKAQGLGSKYSGPFHITIYTRHRDLGANMVEHFSYSVMSKVSM